MESGLLQQLDGLAGVMRSHRKWLALGVDILAYETEHWRDGDLLSEACDTWIEAHPILARTVILSAGALVTAHLANLLRDDYDALSQVFWRRNLDLLLRISGKVQEPPLAEIEPVSGAI